MPVSFDLTDEQKQFQDLARRFAREVIAPVAHEWDERQQYPQQVIEAAFDAGLLNPAIPEAAGGPGLPLFDICLIGEELAWGCMGIYSIMMASDLGVTPIAIAGTTDQQKEFLGPLTEGPRVAAFCLSEPNAGSDAASLRSRLTPKGDGYVLNGVKQWITNGGVADLYVVFATTDPEKGAKGITACVVGKDQSGVKPAKFEDKLGQRAAATAQMVFEDVEVPRSAILGAPGQGFKIALATLDKTRVDVGAGSVGIARRALEEAIAYGKERVQFGRPIIENQALQFKAADMATKIEAARLLVWQAAWLSDRGVRQTRQSAMSKMYGSDIAMEVTVEAIQIFGGYGYSKEYPVEKLMRDVKLNQIYEGTNEILRLVIARTLLD
jgi:acyl-CoA dehydrogenase